MERCVLELTWAAMDGPCTIQRVRVHASDPDEIEREVAAIALFAEDPEGLDRPAHVVGLWVAYADWFKADEHSHI
jgi:hypothetical protein